jgi:CO/xanthine dehydrogenase FAD-binding subunit
MRVESVRPERLLSLARIQPRPPEEGPDGAVRIDALSRLSSLDRSELLARRLPMLAESARVVGSNQVREMGTLGGNLCQENRCLYLNQKHDYQFQTPCYKEGGGCCYPYPNNDPDTCWSVYMSDIAPALIALQAELEIAGPGGTRRLATEELFTGVGLAPLALARDEVL